MKLYGKVLSISQGNEHTDDHEYVVVGLTPQKGITPFPQTITLLNLNWKVGDQIEFDFIARTAAGKT
jgi:hypothetical protein